MREAYRMGKETFHNIKLRLPTHLILYTHTSITPYVVFFDRQKKNQSNANFPSYKSTPSTTTIPILIDTLVICILCCKISTRSQLNFLN